MTELLVMADMLEMWANQIREHCAKKDNRLPSPWQLDDWLSGYRQLYREEPTKEK